MVGRTSCATSATSATTTTRRANSRSTNTKPIRAAVYAGEETVRVAVPDGRGGHEDVMSALTGERIVFLGSRIDENVALETCARLLALEAEDPNGEIKVYINCVAGTQYCVTAILDTLNYVSCPVKTVALGCVAGPPVMLLAAGDKGNRYAMPSARIVLSQPLGGLAGTSIEVKIQAKELNRNAKAQVGFIARFTGRDADELEAMMARDTYMGVQEAIDFGLIDHAL
jgi:ATP-dependent Clp protease protease subunit